MRGAIITGLMACPTCGWEEFEAVFDGDATNFLCRVCHDCWHLQLGWVHRVDPRTCATCRRRGECVAIHEA